jgi:hypothetical protein
MTAVAYTSGAPLTGAPACPTCGGRMWDNRADKAAGRRNAKAPDFKCRNQQCDGRLWPGQHTAAMPIFGPGGRAVPAGQGGPSADVTAIDHDAARRRSYLDATEFVLRDVRPKYQEHGLTCTDVTVAAIVATLFIASCRDGGV